MRSRYTSPMKRLAPVLLCATWLSMACLPAGAAPLGITPAAPRALDPVRAQVPVSGSFLYALDRTRVTMSGNHIQVLMVSGASVTPAPVGFTVDVLLGRLP